MLKKDNKNKILEVFFNNPLPKGIGFQLREISRKIELAPKSVKNYLEELEENNLIVKKPHRIHEYPVYYGNQENDYFKLLKKLDTIKNLNECGLLEFIEDSCFPETIILFGSASRGEDTEDSDIDLYVQSPHKDLNLKNYELKLNRKINLFFEKNFMKLSSELKNNILNGHKLRGYLNVKW